VSDIVERLRYLSKAPGRLRSLDEIDEAMDEAAAEIERLRKELEEVQEEANELVVRQYEVSAQTAEIEHLRLSLSEARATGRREGMEERRLCAIDLWNQLVVLSGYHITRPPTPDHEFVQVCNGDLRKMIDLMGRMYQPTTVGEQRPDNLDVDRFSYAIRAAMEKEE